MDSTSRASAPAIAFNMSAASRTVRDNGPLCERADHKSGLGQYGTSPNVALKPKTPHSAAGMRTEPAPSEPCAIGPIPAATAAAAPPLEPPGVRSSCHGLRVGGPSRLSQESLWPKCGVLVLPKMIA